MDEVRRFQVGLPLEAEGWLKIARGFADSARTYEALKTLQRAKICCPPDNHQLLRVIEEMQTELEPRTEDVPKSSGTLVMESTLEHLEASLDEDPRQPDKLRLLSELYWRGGRRADSIDALWHALWLASDHLHTSLILAERLLDLDRKRAASRIAHQIATAAPNQTSTELRLARVLRRCELVDAALVRLEKIAPLLPRSAEVHYELGLAYADAERLTEAVQALTRASTIRPEWPDPMRALIDVYRKSGREWEGRALQNMLEGVSEAEDPTVDISEFLDHQDEEPSISGITGRLQLLPVPELLQFLGQRRLTGTLKITGSDRVGSIDIFDGAIVGAELSGEPTFADRVIVSGLASREELELGERGTRCCAEFLERNPGMIAKLETECRDRCERILGQLIGWTDGQIDFIAEGGIPREPPFRFDVTFLLLETMRKSDEASSSS